MDRQNLQRLRDRMPSATSGGASSAPTRLGRRCQYAAALRGATSDASHRGLHVTGFIRPRSMCSIRRQERRRSCTGGLRLADTDRRCGRRVPCAARRCSLRSKPLEFIRNVSEGHDDHAVVHGKGRHREDGRLVTAMVGGSGGARRLGRHRPRGHRRRCVARAQMSSRTWSSRRWQWSRGFFSVSGRMIRCAVTRRRRRSTRR